MPAARRIVVHDLAHALAAARAAQEVGVPAVLMSPAGAAGYLGAPYFREIVAAARAAYPGAGITAVLDCGDAAGLALAALRDGAEVIRVAVTDEVRRRLTDIAGQSGARLDDDTVFDSLDLLDQSDAPAACRRWLTHRP